ncbi:hypothetical protein MTO96_033993 [Rhipicephalus appendiculatus]
MTASTGSGSQLSGQGPDFIDSHRCVLFTGLLRCTILCTRPSTAAETRSPLPRRSLVDDEHVAQKKGHSPQWLVPHGPVGTAGLHFCLAFAGEGTPEQ